MRILVLIHEFPPIGGGGGRAAYDICAHLAQNGNQVTILTAHMEGLPANEIQNGIEIIRIKSFRTEAFRASFSVMLAYVLSGLWAGLRFVKRHRPDVIHAHFAVPAGALAWILWRLTGIPYILTAHLGDVPGGVPEKTGAWFRWLLPFTYPIWNRAKRVIAVSEFTRQLALKKYNVQIDVIPNGVDLKSLLPEEIELNQPPRLVFAGRFVTQKNPLEIVKILASLKDLDWHCAMLGDGPLLEEVKAEIKRSHLEDRFELPGWITPDEVLTWFSKSDILFMPSLSEGLPVVGVQALAKGLAIVASAIGGFQDLVVHNENGFL
ncbi:MAG: glycosyltransferase family 4 protein, partial [Anaerolineales bacterium]|nr:glycosyltransferase family 4 protein [Anaerolineales bacterium]